MNRKEDILLKFLEQFPILKGNAQKPCIIFLMDILAWEKLQLLSVFKNIIQL